MGQTKGGVWPLNQCRSFVFSELDDDAATTADDDEFRVRSLAPSPMPTRMFAPEDESPPGRASCTSTIGDGCITNATHLRYALLQAQPGETIALCGGGNLPPITTEDGPLIVQEFNIVLCCADMMMTRHCEIRGNGMHRNLIVTGANITLQGLLFSNGFGLNGDGGNVEIRATGHHRIIHCEFVNGTATNYGGNLVPSSVQKQW
jgi:hypothetical protein